MKRTRRAKKRKPADRFVELARQLRHQLHDIDQKLEHLTGQRVCDFEGQLTLDPRSLNVDEAEYQAILRNL